VGCLPAFAVSLRSYSYRKGSEEYTDENSDQSYDTTILRNETILMDDVEQLSSDDQSSKEWHKSSNDMGERIECALITHISAYV
jgi:hypothetical protein